MVAENAQSIRAFHIPGKNNDAADILSREGPYADNWILNPAIGELLWERFGTARVDLFAAKANHKCLLWFSMSPSQGQGQWPEGPLYSYPPYSCLGDLRERFERENVRMILVALHKPNKNWFSGMRPLIRGERFDIPQWPDALSQANGLIIERPYYRGLVSGLDAHKARHLAQGFEERSVKVMLHSRKESTNASYQGYWGQFSGVSRAQPRSLRSVYHGNSWLC